MPVGHPPRRADRSWRLERPHLVAGEFNDLPPTPRRWPRSPAHRAGLSMASRMPRRRPPTRWPRRTHLLIPTGPTATARRPDDLPPVRTTLAGRERGGAERRARASWDARGRPRTAPTMTRPGSISSCEIGIPAGRRILGRRLAGSPARRLAAERPNAQYAPAVRRAGVAPPSAREVDAGRPRRSGV